MSDQPISMSRSGPPETIMPALEVHVARDLAQALASEPAQRRAAVGAVGVPVSAGDANGANPEILAPDGIVTVPVKVGLAKGAFRSSAV